MNWLKKLFQKKLEPQPEPIKEIIHIPYETIMLRARIQEPAFTRVGYMVDSNYIVTQVKNQLATELLEQIVNQNLIELGYNAIYNDIDPNLLKQMDWFGHLTSGKTWLEQVEP